MPAPRPKTNHKGLQQAFDAIADYLDTLELKLINGGVKVSGGRGTRIVEGQAGQFIVETDSEDFDNMRPWQLIRVSDRLHIVPGHVHLKKGNPENPGVGDFYEVHDPYIGKDSTFGEQKPYWNLPLQQSSAYKIYLVVNPCNAEDVEEEPPPAPPAEGEDPPDLEGIDANDTIFPSSKHEVWLELLKVGEEEPVDTIFGKEKSGKMAHKFLTNSFKTDEEGYPDFAGHTQKLYSDLVVSWDVECSQSSSESSPSSPDSEESEEDEETKEEKALREDLWWRTVPGATGGSVIIKRGMLMYDYMYINGTSGEESWITYKEDWKWVGAGPNDHSKENIKVVGLIEGDYLWVRVAYDFNTLESASGESTGGTNTAGGAGKHQHGIFNEIMMVGGRAGLPEIMFGKNFEPNQFYKDDPGSEDEDNVDPDVLTKAEKIKKFHHYPFARYLKPGKIQQLHLGIIRAPYFMLPKAQLPEGTGNEQVGPTCQFWDPSKPFGTEPDGRCYVVPGDPFFGKEGFSGCVSVAPSLASEDAPAPPPEPSSETPLEFPQWPPPKSPEQTPPEEPPKE
jgi:hypothetical protein